MTERSEGAADKVGVAAKRPTERSEGAADKVGVAAKRPTERSEGAADAVGVAAKRPSLLAELRRRNVIRMAGLYLVGAWLITQVTGTVLPMFDAPAWLPRSIVVLLGIGFIPALVFSWVFELTPEGLKRDAEVPIEHSIAPLTGQKMERMFLLLFALAIGLFVFDKWVLAPKRDARLVVANTTATVAAKTVAELDARQKEINPRSIAVLPFANMSDDAANEYRGC